MKLLLRILVVLAVAHAGCVFGQRAMVMNGIVAIVNDQVITYTDMRRHIGPAMALLEQQYGTRESLLRQKMEETEREGIEQLVETKLILNDFKVSGYVIPENVIEGEINRRISERFGDRSKLMRTLHEDGMTYESYRRTVREMIIVEVLAQKNISSEIFVSPQKIENFYAQNRDKFAVNEQVRVRMIVLNAPLGTDRADIRKRADQILQLGRQGTSFAKLAEDYSEGSQRRQGGDYGWQDRSFFRKDIGDVAFTLPVGKISDVIETPESFHILLVEDRKTAHIRPLNAARAEIEKTLLGYEQNRLRKKYVDRLKKKSFVRYFNS
jgi:peptidyl-prolyl cis-trans isomerase SurA